MNDKKVNTKGQPIDKWTEKKDEETIKRLNMTRSNSSYIPEEHTLMVKGKAYRPPFKAGAGNVTFEIKEYVSCSLSWVLQQEWSVLKIQPIDN